MDQRDCILSVLSIDAKISGIDGNYPMPGTKLTEPDDAKIGEIRCPVCKTIGKFCQPFQVFGDVK